MMLAKMPDTHTPNMLNTAIEECDVHMHDALCGPLRMCLMTKERRKRRRMRRQIIDIHDPP
jgi:hypothetical protein